MSGLTPSCTPVSYLTRGTQCPALAVCHGGSGLGSADEVAVKLQ